MPETGTSDTPRAALKQLSVRLMRPGLESVQRRLEAIEERQSAVESHLLERIDELRALVRQNQEDAVKHDAELSYWRYLVHESGAQKDFGAPFEEVFARWMWMRLVKLGVYLGLPREGEPGDVHDWCSTRSVVEIGPGPFPACAAARKGWKRCAAVDPIARGYVEHNLVPPAAQHVLFIQAPGELIPLASGSADLVICENCLDHVSDPRAVVREILRLLAPGGYFWFFVDLSNHTDHMHPHAMNEQRVRDLLADFETVRAEVSTHRAHPKAYGGYRGLHRKPLSRTSPIRPVPPEHREAAPPE